MRPLAKWTGYLLDSRHRLPTSQSDPSSETDMTRPQWLSPNLQDSKPRLDLGVLILRVNVLIECIHIRHKVLHAIHVHTLAIAQAPSPLIHGKDGNSLGFQALANLSINSRVVHSTMKIMSVALTGVEGSHAR